MNDAQTLRVVENIRDSYTPGSPGYDMAQGQLEAFRRRRVIVDPSAYLDDAADSVAVAMRTADRRPSPRAVARVRPFGKQARKARASFNLAVAVLTIGTVILVCVGVAAGVSGGVY